MNISWAMAVCCMSMVSVSHGKMHVWQQIQENDYARWRSIAGLGSTTVVSLLEKGADFQELEELGFAVDHVFQVSLDENPGFAHHIPYVVPSVMIFQGYRCVYFEGSGLPYRPSLDVGLFELALNGPNHEQDSRLRLAKSWDLSVRYIHGLIEVGNLEEVRTFLHIFFANNPKLSRSRGSFSNWHSSLLRRMRLAFYASPGRRRLFLEELNGNPKERNTQIDTPEVDVFVAIWLRNARLLLNLLDHKGVRSMGTLGSLDEEAFLLLAGEGLATKALEVMDDDPDRILRGIDWETRQESLGLFQDHDPQWIRIQWRTNRIVSSGLTCFLEKGEISSCQKLVASIESEKRRMVILEMAADLFSLWRPVVGIRKEKWDSLMDALALSESVRKDLDASLNLAARPNPAGQKTPNPVEKTE